MSCDNARTASYFPHYERRAAKQSGSVLSGRRLATAACSFYNANVALHRQVLNMLITRGCHVSPLGNHFAHAAERSIYRLLPISLLRRSTLVAAESMIWSDLRESLLVCSLQVFLGNSFDVQTKTERYPRRFCAISNLCILESRTRPQKWQNIDLLR